MGNSKNKRNNRNSHRHVFKRRYHPYKYRNPACTQENVSIKGSRIVNLEKLQEYISKLTVHAAQCGGEILISGEKQNGLAAIISTRCSKCTYTITLETSRKYCSACTHGVPADHHVCYKNWDASSSEMEPDIILEGFKQAEEVHGVRYKRFVGDGDSSVYPTLIQNVPGWGRYIEKLECANHACKCYRSGLEKLVQ